MVHVLLSEEEQEQEQEADTATVSEPAAESIRKERPVHQEKHDTPRKPKQKGTFSSLTQKQTMHKKAPSDKGKAQKGAASSVAAIYTFRLTLCASTLAHPPSLQAATAPRRERGGSIVVVVVHGLAQEENDRGRQESFRDCLQDDSTPSAVSCYSLQ